MIKDGVLHPFGELDVLSYYSKVAPSLNKILKGKELATKLLLQETAILKRGSNFPAIFIDDLKNVSDRLLKLRAGHHLDDVRDKLSEKEILIWRYFVPRKNINFFYACNGEFGKTIDRIFIDIDRQDKTKEEARLVCKELVKTIKQDSEFNKLVKYKILILWTGSSFHVYLLLKKQVDKSFYEKYLSFGEKKDGFTKKWASIVSEKLKMDVFPGHERKKNAIIIDSSNTPPGKLARAPFSLHLKDYKNIDGVCVPLTEKELEDKKLIEKLEKLTPEKVLNNIKNYSKLLRD